MLGVPLKSGVPFDAGILFIDAVLEEDDLGRPRLRRLSMMLTAFFHEVSQDRRMTMAVPTIE